MTIATCHISIRKPYAGMQCGVLVCASGQVETRDRKS